jgi:hypothetical protein
MPFSPVVPRFCRSPVALTKSWDNCFHWFHIFLVLLTMPRLVHVAMMALPVLAFTLTRCHGVLTGPLGGEVRLVTVHFVDYPVEVCLRVRLAAVAFAFSFSAFSYWDHISATLSKLFHFPRVRLYLSHHSRAHQFQFQVSPKPNPPPRFPLRLLPVRPLPAPHCLLSSRW